MAERIALVDLGSNAIRLLTARIKPGRSFEILSEQRVSTRLGNGGPGLLKPSAIRKTLKAVDRFLNDMRGEKTRVVAVATAAVRDATNKMRLLEPLRRDAGIRVRILSGEEEAYLGAWTVLYRWPEWSGLILDLGGGSLQLTRIRNGRILSAVSLPLGVIWTTARFLQHDPPQPSELVSLRQEIAVQLTDVLTPAQEQEELIGLGGTVRSLCRMNKARKQPPCQNKFFPLQRSVITTFLEQLGKIPAEELVYPGLKAERADTIIAGMVTIEEIMLRSGFSSLTVLPQGGVRHGILMRETFDSPSIPPQRAPEKGKRENRWESEGQHVSSFYQPGAVLAGVQ